MASRPPMMAACGLDCEPCPLRRMAFDEQAWAAHGPRYGEALERLKALRQ